VDAWRRTIDVNVTGTFICSKAVIPGMVDAGHGHIVNLASMAGELALGERAAYNTSKAAIVGLTKSIAVEVGAAGIHCNAVAPGVIETPLSAPYFEDEAMVRVLRENSPMDRWGQVEEIAGPVLFLCSEESSFGSEPPPSAWSPSWRVGRTGPAVGEGCDPGFLDGTTLLPSLPVAFFGPDWTVARAAGCASGAAGIGSGVVGCGAGVAGGVETVGAAGATGVGRAGTDGRAGMGTGTGAPITTWGRTATFGATPTPSPFLGC